jgi:stearoyl-CoA desaturase (delta-9 desaturase)
VWDLKSPPQAVLRNEQKLGSRVIERAAADVARTFNTESIAAALHQALATTPTLADLQERLAAAQHRAGEVLAGMHLPHLPTREEILSRASAMFVPTRSMEDIAERAHRMIADAVGTRLAARTA